MTPTPRTYLPPRQQTPPVQRIAKWALIGATTLALAASLYLFFRGTKPKRVSFTPNAAPTTAMGPITDGWVRGLPDEPTATEPPAKPLPPVDEQARREVLRLQQLMREREEQMNHRLDDIHKLLLQQKPAPAPAAAPKPIKRPPMYFVTAESNNRTTVPPDTFTLAPGAAKFPCIVETKFSSDIDSLFTAKLTRPVYDTATGQHLLVPQGSTILGHASGESLVFGNERLPTMSLSLALPDGRSVEIGEAPILDREGVTGLVSSVNNHWWRNIGATLIMGTLRGGQQVMQQGLANTGEAGQFTAGVANTTTAFGQQTLNRAIDTRPTIVVDAGEGCNVLLRKPLSLPRYEAAVR